MKSAKRIFLVVLGILIGVAAVIFMLSNKQQVVVTFLYWESHPLWISVTALISFTLGGISGLLLAGWLTLRYRGRIRRLRKEIRRIENELIDYRNQPLAEAGLLSATEDDELAPLKDGS